LMSLLLAVGLGTGVNAYLSMPAARLRAALHIKKSPIGAWQWPTVKVMDAIIGFGSNRADAYPILEKAVRGSDLEAQKQAIAAMGFIARPAMTNTASFVSAHPRLTPLQLASLQAEPATNAIPLLREVLFANNELSPFALASLHGLFEAKDIPALADLLMQSHDDNAKPRALAQISNAPQAQNAVDRADVNLQLQRYIPEAIAETIRQNPETATPFISSVEDLLDDANPDARFGAACALAKSKIVKDSRISRELTAALRARHDNSRPYPATEGLKQLMAIETLQHIGPDAKPMIPALLDYADSTQDRLMRELALRAAGNIDSNLRNTMPEVDQAVKSDPNRKNMVSPSTN